jgi:hypothetical protein
MHAQSSLGSLQPVSGGGCIVGPLSSSHWKPPVLAVDDAVLDTVADFVEVVATVVALDVDDEVPEPPEPVVSSEQAEAADQTKQGIAKAAKNLLIRWTSANLSPTPLAWRLSNHGALSGVRRSVFEYELRPARARPVRGARSGRTRGLRVALASARWMGRRRTAV